MNKLFRRCVDVAEFAYRFPRADGVQKALDRLHEGLVLIDKHQFVREPEDARALRAIARRRLPQVLRAWEGLGHDTHNFAALVDTFEVDSVLSPDPHKRSGLVVDRGHQLPKQRAHRARRLGPRDLRGGAVFPHMNGRGELCPALLGKQLRVLHSEGWLEQQLSLRPADRELALVPPIVYQLRRFLRPRGELAYVPDHGVATRAYRGK